MSKETDTLKIDVEQLKKAHRMLPRCETKEVNIVPDVMSEVDLSCDTGIR